MAFESFPSQEIKNKEGQKFTEKDNETIFEFVNSPEKYDHVLLDTQKPLRQNEDKTIYPHDSRFEEFNFDNRYGFKRPNKSGYNVAYSFDMSENIKDINIVED